MKKIDILGWDNGYDSEKMTFGENDNLVFPSIAFIPEKSSINIIEKSSSIRKNKMIISFNDKEYFVGDYAIEQSTNDFKPDLQEDRFKKETETVKFLAGLSTRFPNEDEFVIKNLFAGLSISAYKNKNYKKEKENKYNDTFKYYIPSSNGKKEVTVTVNNVEVYPQGVTSYFTNILDWKGEPDNIDLLQRRYMLIDIGGNTTDAFIARGSNVIRGTAISLQKGTSDAFKEVQNKYDNQLSLYNIKTNYEDYSENEKKTKCIVFDNYKTFDITNDIKNAFQNLAESVYTQLTSQWNRKTGTEKYAYLTGGGAYSLGSYIEGQLPESIENIVITDPQLSNANGLYKIGKSQK